MVSVDPEVVAVVTRTFEAGVAVEFDAYSAAVSSRTPTPVTAVLS